MPDQRLARVRAAYPPRWWRDPDVKIPDFETSDTDPGVESSLIRGKAPAAPPDAEKAP